MSGIPPNRLVTLALYLRELPAQLSAAQVEALFAVARRSTTWARP